MKNFCQSFTAFSFAMMFFVGAASAYAAPCMTTEEDKGRVVETIRQMYAAAAKDDLDGFHRVTTTEFFAFDGGRRFDGDSLMNLIKTAHDAGKRYEVSLRQRIAASDRSRGRRSRGAILRVGDPVAASRARLRRTLQK